MRLDRRGLLALLPGTAALGGPAAGQTVDFPTRPITMVVGFPPGGQADLAARPVAAAMERNLRQPVVVQNRPGGAGAIGSGFVSRAAPDGQTLLMALSSLAVIPEAERLFGRPPPYTVDQFAPIGLVNADPTVLAVPANAPWANLAEFVAAARARPGDIPYGSSGAYGTLHVAMEMFASAAQIRLLHVPFQGAGPAITALLSGNIQALATAPGTVTQHVQSGRVRVLACWGRERAPAFPDVPTFMEAGFPEVEFYIWAGLFAPAATPVAIQLRLRESLRLAMQDPELLRAFETAGSPPRYLDAPDFARFFVEDSARLVRAVQRIGRVE
ncbi:Bug family tripartite tricarboxylate transporter substrate binding protein [Sediminicoccus rosea]|jgi:tripartite-type tricarboxylate transporter receptor subunit TctC|uniref:Tripartite tricarboxylate transporter substrate binding protein n=1 Tax=Sediminicoccus rosea TaxID=1225128 RepID=A0ABZ0PGT9_9PROT|nr:tripartite tricarboxylate transporter substrate binding protein [Sediminicoccus rosea]WPB84864.1 tripartite tricarboxylate transporter substrate binding protein [Sediminicoccus rosea]